jgi:ADP-ribose pyrophosphatase YjhB (NUDIX family)
MLSREKRCLKRLSAVREVKEETNLDVRIIKLIGVYSDPESQIFSYPDGKVIHFVTICFLAEIEGGKLRGNPSETLDVRFFDQHALPNDLFPMHPQWLKDALANKEAAFIR